MSDKLSDERQNICMICMLKCKMFEKHDEYMPQCGLLEESFLLISWLVTTPVEYIPLSWVGFKNLLMWGVHLPGYPEVELGSLEWTAVTWQNQCSLKLQELKFQIRSCLHCCVGEWGKWMLSARAVHRTYYIYMLLVEKTRMTFLWI